MGFTSRRAAEAVRLDVAHFGRVERAATTPTRETARRIFKFYRGAIPLGMIFDPKHPTYIDWLDDKNKKILAAVGQAIIEEHPKLGERDRRKR